MELHDMSDGFRNAFGYSDNLRFFHAPGRVNLIGEHIDYNGGYVFPCALSIGIWGAACKRDDNLIRLSSGNISPKVILRLPDASFNIEDGWGNYPKAVITELIKMRYKLGGMDLYIYGDLPSNAGLSSSACIELLTCVTVENLFDLSIDPIERVKLCQRAENHFIGVNCGIMDQFASGMGKKDNAIMLNCATLDFTYVPLVLGEYKIVIANSNKKRGLSDSKYNERRAECEQALTDIQCIRELENLCDLTPEEFNECKHIIKNPITLNRTAHAVNENARTIKAVEALRRNDLKSFGALMNLSHISLRDLYEVSGAELDALVDAAWEADGVLGSRMTGAGFGGCTVSIVHSNAVSAFIEKVGDAYKQCTGLTADFYVAETGDGAHEIN